MRKYDHGVVLIEDTVEEPMEFRSLRDAAHYLYDSDMSPGKPTEISIYTALVYAVKHNNRYKNYTVMLKPNPQDFSAADHYRGKQCTNIYLPNYSESLALHALLVHSNFLINDSCDYDFIENGHMHHFTITVDGTTVDFIFGGPQYDALMAFIQHIAGENLYEVTESYVKGW
jgi:hypothetical protein